MDYKTILYAEDAAAATITLNRPEKLNSFTAEMHGELRHALDRVRAAIPAGRVRALVLTGAGRGFCAGQDLSERAVGMQSGPPDLGRTLSTHYNPLILGLRALEIPVIAAVNGVAAGAGANFALAADIVLAARSASFIQAFARLGLVPDAGGTYHLPRLVGPARAMGLALLAEPLSAEKAEQWGLIWKSVDDDKLMDEAHALSRKFSAGPTLGYARIKRALNASAGNTLEEQLALEAELQRDCGQSSDYREGIAAFLSKRAPVFTGR
ncbi:MAG: 2-(1,2-epoxy-1,2-dihydrophenyl)acetyl-CoA isomerase PaaG [Rhodospirillales bacterium]